MRILITHNDLDGISCAILAIYFDQFDRIYSIGKSLEINDNWINNLNNQVLITDLSISEDLITKNISIIDHHKTSSYIKKFSNCIHDTSKSATRLIYENYYQKLNKNSKIEKFVELVDKNDLFDFSDIDSEYNLNRLFLGLKTFESDEKLIYDHGLIDSNYKLFIETIINKFLSKSKIFNYSESDMKIINKQLSIDQSSLKFAENLLRKRIDQKNNKFGITNIFFGNQSIIGYKLLINHPDLKYIILIYPDNLKRLSIRSQKDFDCTSIPNIYGHKNAGGGSFSEKFVKRLINDENMDLF